MNWLNHIEVEILEAKEEAKIKEIKLKDRMNKSFDELIQ